MTDRELFKAAQSALIYLLIAHDDKVSRNQAIEEAARIIELIAKRLESKESVVE